VIDLKDYLQTAVVSRLLIRVRGTIAQVGNASQGAATGRDNPESLFVNVTARSTPAVGAVSKNSLTARGCIQQRIFECGYSIHAAALADPASGHSDSCSCFYYFVELRVHANDEVFIVAGNAAARPD